MSTKTAIITGGTRGLGYDMAINLAKQGNNVIFSYANNEQKAQEVVSEMEALGVKSAAFAFDANQPESGRSFVQQSAEYLKKEGLDTFDFLINNAGTGTFGLINNTQEAQFDEMMNAEDLTCD